MNYNLCSKEEIRIPGKIQPFGYLIGLDHSNYIQFYSENILSLFRQNTDLIHQSLEELPVLYDWVNQHTLTEKESDLFIDVISIDHTAYYIYLTYFQGMKYLQLEEKLTKRNNLSLQIFSTDEYDHHTHAIDLWNTLLKDLYAICSYDRIMVYQFLSNGSGKVIAEHKNEGIESYLNLHYPAHDIPAQARALYLQHQRRIYSDVDRENVKVIMSDEQAVDLSRCDARTMSPMHCQYLKNAGVKSSFSTSIIVEGKLWGLVTCQNIEARHIDLKDRILAERLTKYVAKLYTIYYYKDIHAYTSQVESNILQLKNKLFQHTDFQQSMIEHLDEFLHLAEADGVVYYHQGKILSKGVTPSESKTAAILDWYAEQRSVNSSMYIHDSFGKNYPTLLDDPSATAGIVIHPLNIKDHTYFIWFRKEYSEHIYWAGNPYLDPKPLPGTAFISPRESFKVFKEEIQGQSKTWSAKDQIVLEKLHQLLYEVSFNHFGRIQEYNRQLNEINHELNTFASTVSHDLGTPLTVIKLRLQLLKNQLKDAPTLLESLQSVQEQVDSLEKMMKNILEVSKISTVDLNYGTIHLKPLIEDLVEKNKFIYHPNTVVEYGELPDIYCEPTLVHQVFQNILSNAIKYSSQQATPCVKVQGTVEEDYIVYRISDNGIGIPADQLDHLFKSYKRLANAQSFEGTGFGLSIVQKIMQRIRGKCEVYNNTDEGTTFELYFRR